MDSGSMLLAHSLNKYITVHHGKGSVIQAKPIAIQMSQLEFGESSPVTFTLNSPHRV